MTEDSESYPPLGPWELLLVVNGRDAYVQAATQDPAGLPALREITERLRQRVQTMEETLRDAPMSDAERQRLEVALFQSGPNGIDQLTASNPRADLALLHIQTGEFRRRLRVAEATLAVLDQTA